MMTTRKSRLPAMPLDQWEATKETLHLFLQIVGKVRLALFPQMNHWWNASLYVSCRGITTRPIPHKYGLFEIEFDFLDNVLRVLSTDGRARSFPLARRSVAGFYRTLLQNLNQMGISASINPQPYGLSFSDTPFSMDNAHASYQRTWIEQYWQTLLFVDAAFQEFRARFIGKSSPVHLFWRDADLALTRFSGKTASPPAGANRVAREAYSHELISVGFWFGDTVVREPAFYAYAHPEPQGLSEEKLVHPEADWRTDYGYTMAFLPYNAVREADNPKEYLLAFLENTYQILAQRAGWDLTTLTFHPDAGA